MEEQSKLIGQRKEEVDHQARVEDFVGVEEEAVVVEEVLVIGEMISVKEETTIMMGLIGAMKGEDIGGMIMVVEIITVGMTDMKGIVRLVDIALVLMAVVGVGIVVVMVEADMVEVGMAMDMVVAVMNILMGDMIIGVVKVEGMVAIEVVDMADMAAWKDIMAGMATTKMPTYL